MTYVCIGCHVNFDKSRSLEAHKRTCRSHKTKTGKLKTLIRTLSLSAHRNHAKIMGSAIPEHEIPRHAEPDVSRSPERHIEIDLVLDEQLLPPGLLPPIPQEYRPDGRPRRRTRLPKRFVDDLPPPAPPIIPGPIPLEPDIEPDAEPVLLTPDFTSEENSFNIYRVYKGGKPTFNPDDSEVINAEPPNPSHHGPPLEHLPSYHPFDNSTTYRLMSWYYNGSNTKSISDLNKLVTEILLAEDFSQEHLKGFEAGKEYKRLDDYQNDPGSGLAARDGWIEASVPISLPCDGFSFQTEADAPVYYVEGLLYRKPLEVIKAAFTESAAAQFHTTPFQEFWKPSPDAAPERLYSEVYNSDAFIEEHTRIRSQPRLDCNLETIVASIMLWSDSTHLTSFGNASLWPIYLYLGNQSKYTRGKPTSFAGHHMAYIPKLDDTIQDFYRKEFGKSATGDVLTHLRRELMQAIWRLLLDEEFMEAYRNGIVILFPDGLSRRVFPRFSIYSADYPEKVLLACIKYLGKHPCPRCIVEKSHICELGSKSDLRRREKLGRIDDANRQYDIEAARRLIYTKGVRVNSKRIAAILDPKSLVPTRNAFSERLAPLGFNFYTIFAPDLLHEVELGIWKNLFTHLLRILYAAGGDSIMVLNSRYRQIPTFGRDTIRKFTNNASGMKKLAARDFEDLLQCAIPVFEGLLPDKHNKIVMSLLFEMATWHFLAKLRLHTESTLTSLMNSTTRLGIALRKFTSITCSAYVTKDLPSEEAARGRRKAALAQKKGPGLKQPTKPSTSAARERNFILSTYKFHAIPDYASYIRLNGTTDGFTTQVGELEHRRVKRFYPRVHKGKFKFVSGIARHVRRERILHNLRKKQNLLPLRPPLKKRKLTSHTSFHLPFSATETFQSASPNQHYEMTHDTKFPIDITTDLGNNLDDPARAGFLDQLTDHLLGRILQRDYQGDDLPFTDEERANLKFVNNRLYRHKVLRINYTSYDMRREQDSLNPCTHANVMMLSHEEDSESHPYWYARIIGLFHVVVRHPSSINPITLDVARVRWYGKDPDSYQSGWKARRLPRIGFVEYMEDDSSSSPAFGFIDPTHIIRGVHLIPAFHYGMTNELLAPSTSARLPGEGDLDFKVFYVNIFVDRDMAMRFRGGGVGHTSTRAATNTFLLDRDILDLGGARDDGDDEELGDDFEDETRDADEGENGPDEEEEWSDIEETQKGLGGEFEYGSESEEDIDEDEELADDALGPDDGEFDDDAVAGLGFAAF